LAFEIRQFGDPVLKTPAKRVTVFDDALKRLVEGMLETLHAGEDRMAIAANQVGVLKRVFVAETGGERYVLVNPVIEEKTTERETALEGCLSIPGIGVEVERYSGVVICGQDEEGRPVRYQATGEIARMMQHERDHLDGVLMLERTDHQSRKRAMRQWRERLLARG
jgi:peptide deformylase